MTSTVQECTMQMTALAHICCRASLSLCFSLPPQLTATGLTWTIAAFPLQFFIKWNNISQISTRHICNLQAFHSTGWRARAAVLVKYRITGCNSHKTSSSDFIFVNCQDKCFFLDYLLKNISFPPSSNDDAASSLEVNWSVKHESNFAVLIYLKYHLMRVSKCFSNV